MLILIIFKYYRLSQLPDHAKLTNFYNNLHYISNFKSFHDTS